MAKHFGAKISNGKLVLDNKDYFNNSIKNMSQGSYVIFLVRQDAKTIREFQNLYFAILGTWSEDTGWTKDDLHDLIKAELFPDITDKTSTQDLDTIEWHSLLLNLENFLLLKFENK